MQFIRSSARDQLASLNGLLITFQDQHIFSQALVAGARDAGWQYALIQDGYLDFDMAAIPKIRRAFWPAVRQLNRLIPHGKPSRLRTLLYKEFYYSHFFGHTVPDWTFVLGPSLAQRISKQFGIVRNKIICHGPIIKQTFSHKVHNIQTTDPHQTRILFFDQCFTRYNRIKPNGWDKEYLPLLRTLAKFGVLLKMHPSQTKHAAEDVAEAIGGSDKVIGGGLLSAGHLKDIDLAITVTSTTFIDCLANGIPVVFVSLPSCYDRMPRIKSSLLRNVDTLEELSSFLKGYTETGRFEANKTGLPLTNYVNYEGGGAVAISRTLGISSDQSSRA